MQSPPFLQDRPTQRQAAEPEEELARWKRNFNGSKSETRTVEFQKSLGRIGERLELARTIGD